MTVPDTIVCMKVVPRPEEVRVDLKTMTLDRSGRSLINPADMHAIEAALALKDRYGGTVKLLAMGPPLFEDYLRVALAMGADEAYLLSDRAFGGADTLATSYTLAAGVRKIGRFDLVLCGEESSDGATAQVPPGIAEWLDIPQITYATELALIDSRWRIRATRELSGGHEVIVSPLPAVVSVKMRANEPRFMDMGRREWASEAPITVWDAEDLDVDPGMIGTAGSPTTVSGTREAARRERRRETLSGSPAEQARALLDRIRPYLDAARSNGHGSTAPKVHLPPGVAEDGGEASAPASAADLRAPVSGRASRAERAEAAGEAGEAAARWTGRAVLLDTDGDVIAELLADLWKRSRDRGSLQWGGVLRTELGGGHLPAVGDYLLCLETDTQAEVMKHGAIKAYSRNGLNGEEVEVRGRGDPPF